MEILFKILTAAGIFAGLGLLFGALLALASKLFAVKKDPRIDMIAEVLPGANCGGCGRSGCAALAADIAAGKASPSSCTVGGARTAVKIAEIMGIGRNDQPLSL